MKSSRVGWMSLTKHHTFRMRFSEEHDGHERYDLWALRAAGLTAWGRASRGPMPLTNYKEVFVPPAAGLGGTC